MVQACEESVRLIGSVNLIVLSGVLLVTYLCVISELNSISKRHILFCIRASVNFFSLKRSHGYEIVGEKTDTF